MARRISSLFFLATHLRIYLCVIIVASLRRLYILRTRNPLTLDCRKRSCFSIFFTTSFSRSAISSVVFRNTFELPTWYCRPICIPEVFKTLVAATLGSIFRSASSTSTLNRLTKSPQVILTAYPALLILIDSSTPEYWSC